MKKKHRKSGKRHGASPYPPGLLFLPRDLVTGFVSVDAIDPRQSASGHPAWWARLLAWLGLALPARRRAAAATRQGHIPAA